MTRRPDPPPRPRGAAIDLGTNSARFAVGEMGRGGRLRLLALDRRVLRFGEGLDASGRLSRAAAERALAALADFRRQAEARGAHFLLAAGTSALRRAEDREKFLARARGVLGAPLRVLTEEEEARLALRGALEGLEGTRGKGGSLWAFDIGGGSLEVMRAEGGELTDYRSLPLGVVYLTERFLPAMPTSEKDLRRLEAHAEEALGGLPPGLRPWRGRPFVGTGGVVALATLMAPGSRGYRPGLVHGRRVGAREVARWRERVAALGAEERRALPSLEPGREDTILAGLAVVGSLLGWAGRAGFRVSEWGLREGLLVEGLSGGAHFVSTC